MSPRTKNTRSAGRRSAIALLSIVVLALGACGSDDEPTVGGDNGGSDENTVVVELSGFDPEALTVAVGDTVTWEWSGDVDHNVIEKDKVFQSETIKEGEFSHTFAEAGEFHYVCTLHPNMKGTITVQ